MDDTLNVGAEEIKVVNNETTEVVFEEIPTVEEVPTVETVEAEVI